MTKKCYTRVLRKFGSCDCHSHVFGPFSTFPLSEARTFDPPEEPIEALEHIWERYGFDRAVIVQGSPYAFDSRAMLHAIERSPQTRRGVALLPYDIGISEIERLHTAGVRAVRFNWISHLLARQPFKAAEHLERAAELLRLVGRYGWHAEVHVDIADLFMVDHLEAPPRMPIVIDHMARMHVDGTDHANQLSAIVNLLQNDRYWVKISGADRLVAHSGDLTQALHPMQAILAVAKDRCVWGLDRPHVNLLKKQDDDSLVDLLRCVAGEQATLESLLIHNPSRLYDFPPLGDQRIALP